jgi:hypothetical protein
MISWGTSSISKVYFGDTEVQKIYLGTDLIYSAEPQLSAPTNVSVSDTTASFDEVENAESYEFFVDGVSIGEYAPPSTGGVPASNVTVYGEGDFADCVVTIDGNNVTSTVEGYGKTTVFQTISTSFTVYVSHAVAAFHNFIYVYTDSTRETLLFYSDTGNDSTIDLSPHLVDNCYVVLELDS